MDESFGKHPVLEGGTLFEGGLSSINGYVLQVCELQSSKVFLLKR